MRTHTRTDGQKTQATTDNTHRYLHRQGQPTHTGHSTHMAIRMQFSGWATRLGRTHHRHTTCRRSSLSEVGAAKTPSRAPSSWALKMHLRRATARTHTHGSRRTDSPVSPRHVHRKGLLRSDGGVGLLRRLRRNQPAQASRACAARGRGGRTGCEAHLSRRRSCVLMSAARS